MELENFKRYDFISNKIKMKLSNQLKVVDWRQLNPSLFNAIEVEKNVMFLILLLIIIVAAFNLISSMFFLVSNKKKDIGVLRVLSNGNWTSIALMGGFAEVEANDVTVLVNAAELGVKIDTTEAEAELEKAKSEVSQLEGQANSTEKVKAQENLNRARARVQASKA